MKPLRSCIQYKQCNIDHLKDIEMILLCVILHLINNHLTKNTRKKYKLE